MKSKRKMFVKIIVSSIFLLMLTMVLNAKMTRIVAQKEPENKETSIVKSNNIQYITDDKQQKEQNIGNRSTTGNEIAITLTETDNYGKPLADVGVILQKKMNNGTWTTFNNENIRKTDSNGQIVLPESLVKLIKEKGGKEDNLAFRFRVVSVPTGYVEPPAYSGTDKETAASKGGVLYEHISDVMTITSDTTTDYHVRMYSNLKSSENFLNNPYFYYGNNTTNIPGWSMFIGMWGFPGGVTPIGPTPQISGTMQKWKAIPFELNNKINEWAYTNSIIASVYTVNDPTNQVDLGELISPKYDENTKTLRFDYDGTNANRKSDFGIVIAQNVMIKPNTLFRFGMSYRLPGNGANAELIEARVYKGKQITGIGGVFQTGTSDNTEWKDIYVERKTGSSAELLTLSLRIKLPKEKKSWAEIKAPWVEPGAIDDSGAITENTGEPKSVAVEYYKDQTNDGTVDIPATSLGRSWSAPLKTYSDGYVLDYATLDGKKVTTNPVKGIFKSSAQTVKYYYRKAKYKLVADDVTWENQPVNTVAPTAKLFDNKVYVYDGDTKIEAIDSTQYDATIEDYDSSAPGSKSFKVKFKSKTDLNTKYPGLGDNDTVYGKLNTTFFSVLSATAIDQTNYIGDNQPSVAKIKKWVKNVQIDGKSIEEDYTVELLDTWDSAKVEEKSYKIKVTSGSVSETISVKVNYIPSGNLSVTVPKLLEFDNVPIQSKKTQIIPRKNNQWDITVDDQRNNTVRADWQLSMRIKDDFSLEQDGQKHILKGILIFKDTTTSEPVFINGENYPILKSSTDLPNETTKSWSKDTGMLLELDQSKSAVARNGDYQATLEFTLEDAP
ncbi:hypothetical protein UAW_00987 [Enterococcus haemoperoxidus ATCC BAA-382]|uniref:MucBP domain-containing protein n=1 Tax=Enterococcus haemoperoxidus ATCC BAA-382 TaxID=1158608 RepID=R2TI76_9ENTE|nr:hypothetical protein [Enterococcus haemoperoxidus]EOH99834.1 hypothetical protein UAW_00987 [Enterococcus haemoperoxidus ATCC BAA-382]EOT62424.1 hypothetical protein I583_01424 [Enterococcus haemoperoxidus ATCC BAA-382]OJG54280.1 hypothetical protein RV06_GL002948 [Enterococcus haemoperoxidus]